VAVGVYLAGGAGVSGAVVVGASVAGAGSPLGNGLDWLVGGLALSLIVSTIFAQFRMQAIWYSWAAACVLAGLYAIASWLDRRDRQLRLLTFQGYLNLAFIAVSLGLWTSQTWLPELERLRSLYSPGLALPYDFSQIELRNWAPIGHQNYVAGYLVWRYLCCWLWGLFRRAGGAGSGLLGLGWTVTSTPPVHGRDGWRSLCLQRSGLALWCGQCATSALDWADQSGLCGSAAGAGADEQSAAIANFRRNERRGRWRTGLSADHNRYRLADGTDHLFTGAGLGNVPLLYQRESTVWAGREAELV
jgi:hypothetical protein